MKIIKYLLFLSAFSVFFLGFSVKLQAQDFWIGSYLNSSNNKEITYYQNYWQINQLGLNTVLQRNIVSVPSINQESNFDCLMQFNNIIAMNDSAFGSASNENNIDWIYYFTNALYSKWEAEGSPYFIESEPVGIKHNGVGDSTSGGWSSGSNQSDINKFFILGPNYSQYMKYVYTNKFNPNEPVNYETNFRIKLAQAQTGSFPVARLIISVKNNSDGTETPLIDSTIYSNQLTTSYTNIICNYNYSRFQPPDNGESNYIGTPPPGPAWYAPQSTASSDFFNENLKIQFKVQRLAAPEIIVDYIEVYDQLIWENRFIGSINYIQTVNRINTYNQKFATLGTKLKYYHTIDEPHSIDCFYPISKVQSILDSLNTGRDLITHFYPGWDNNRDGVNILEKWLKIAKPKKLMFWYFLIGLPILMRWD